jgi:hypothetical protein
MNVIGVDSGAESLTTTMNSDLVLGSTTVTTPIKVDPVLDN